MLTEERPDGTLYFSSDEEILSVPTYRWIPPLDTHESIQRFGSPSEKYLLAQIDDLSRRLTEVEQTIKKPLIEKLRLLLKQRILVVWTHRFR